jgi:hypothetical protein
LIADLRDLLARDFPRAFGLDLLISVYRFFAGGPFWATAALMSAWNAPGSTCSPSWMSIALRVPPSKLELKRRDGSGRLAPRANVSFTTFLYVSPVQTIPLCDQTGTPVIAFDGFLHLRSSTISGSASRISALMRARVWSRQSLVAALRGSLARDAGLAFGVALLARFAFGFADLLVIIRPLLLARCPIKNEERNGLARELEFEG